MPHRKSECESANRAANDGPAMDPTREIRFPTCGLTWPCSFSCGGGEVQPNSRTLLFTRDSLTLAMPAPTIIHLSIFFFLLSSFSSKGYKIILIETNS